MRGGPICRLSPDLRRELVAGFVGRPVIVEHSYTRAVDGAQQTVVGVLISVARATLGTGTDLAVIRQAGGAGDVALSLATVLSIGAVR